ncbi:MAG: hypothetical protein V7K35_28745 [Nostoc sp.]
MLDRGSQPWEGLSKKPLRIIWQRDWKPTHPAASTRFPTHFGYAGSP